MKLSPLSQMIADAGSCAEKLRRRARLEFKAEHQEIAYRYEKAADHLERARLHLSYILSHPPDPPGG